MNIAQGFQILVVVVLRAESRCSPNSYYKNCWIRSFPGILVDTDASGKRGARLLRTYREERALKCSRNCCLAVNASCNVAVFHYDASQDNCYHLHCPTLESCIISHSTDAVLYNITKGVDPDLLVFGKHFNSNIRVGRINASELLPLDKRQFFHPPPAAATVKPTPSRRFSTITLKPSSITTFQTTIHTLSTTIVHYRTPTPPTLRSITSTNTKVPKTETPVKERDTNDPNTQVWTKKRDINYRSTKSLHKELGTNNPSTQTSVKEIDANNLSKQMAIKEQETSHARTLSSVYARQTWAKDRGTNKSFTQLSVKERDTNNPGTQMSVKERGSTPGREDPLADLGQGYQGLPVVLVVCVAVLLGCFIWLLARWRTKRRRMEYYHTSGRRGAMHLIKYHLVAEGNT
ncbi:uncharacterized protein LOC130916007 [Corythoichthys intestinalis]|uniref:uncharacterized protein LOC130916007 n=1 Tax=Corythoichthys intestinalis TaxID=161448 RepID=UPI0025A5B9A8|nr:uncharacterized protein LOC130916007 [Corythoichthys intestinalis]